LRTQNDDSKKMANPGRWHWKNPQGQLPENWTASCGWAEKRMPGRKQNLDGVWHRPMEEGGRENPDAETARW
jgi:hypothetical protein